MTTITVEAKRVDAGRSLTSFQNQAIAAINQLSGIKTNLLNLRTQITADPDFAEADITEVNATISDLATRIKTLLE